MNRLALPLSAIAIAILAGCAAESRVAPAPAPVTVTPAPAAAVVTAPATTTAAAPTVVVPAAGTAPVVVASPAPQPLRAGTGAISQIINLPASAAAGSSVPGATKRITIRMDDGSLQYLDTAATDLSIGERVSLTNDGTMKYPAP
ncbi:MAG: hypothetical protein JOZ85_04055 [Betaproteobacteria bacterium]|nr:hypothetical protein [Betaproteobacteria bacterium]